MYNERVETITVAEEARRPNYGTVDGTGFDYIHVMTIHLLGDTAVVLRNSSTKNTQNIIMSAADFQGLGTSERHGADCLFISYV